MKADELEAALVRWAPTVLKGVAVVVRAAAPESDPRMRDVTYLAGAAIAGEAAARLQANDPWRAALATATAATAASAGLIRATRLSGELAEARRTAATLAPLAGTLTLASTRAVDRLIDDLGWGSDPKLRAAATVGSAGLAGTAIVLLTGGNRAYALALGWGLAEAAAQAFRQKRTATVVAAGVGLAAVAAATWYAGRRSGG